jgi:hypothetical protein
LPLIEDRGRRHLDGEVEAGRAAPKSSARPAPRSPPSRRATPSRPADRRELRLLVEADGVHEVAASNRAVVRLAFRGPKITAPATNDVVKRMVASSRQCRAGSLGGGASVRTQRRGRRAGPLARLLPAGVQDRVVVGEEEPDRRRSS